MGGNAFSAKELFMPRMPPDVYRKVLERVQAQLRTIYARAETPIEGPGKTDHGDIDVLVIAKTNEPHPTLEQVAEKLGAEEYFTNGSTRHFALPWPQDEDGHGSNSVREQPKYIQVDVNHCPTMASFEYKLFGHTHGDLWCILGVVLRRFGFVSTPDAFFVIDEELESVNKSLARTKLTDDPDMVLRYLGLDKQQYWSRFKNWDECMDYIAQCRFHDPARGEQYDDVDINENKDLKSTDRSKARKRAMMNYWFEQYLPQHRDGLAGSASRLTRAEALLDAKQFFGNDIAKEFDEKRHAGLRKKGADKLWSDVRKEINCQGSDLTFAMKGLKFEVVEDAEAKAVGDLSDVQRAFRDGKFDAVKEWVRENWEDVKTRQQQRDQDKCSAKLLSHREKLKIAQTDDNGDNGQPTIEN